MIATLDEVVTTSLNKTAQFLDMRSPGEFNGTDNRGNARAGHIPGLK